jgi:GNAT superfamily N-acetyltransferase
MRHGLGRRRHALDGTTNTVIDFRDHNRHSGSRHSHARESLRGPEAARDTLLGLLKNPVFGLAWLVLDSDAPVGYIVLFSSTARNIWTATVFIGEFYLVDSHRGHGWGRKRLEFVRASAVRKRVRAIHLEGLGGRSFETTLATGWQQFGFVVAGEAVLHAVLRRFPLRARGQ